MTRTKSCTYTWVCIQIIHCYSTNKTHNLTPPKSCQHTKYTPPNTPSTTTSPYLFLHPITSTHTRTTRTAAITWANVSPQSYWEWYDLTRTVITSRRIFWTQHRTALYQFIKICIITCYCITIFINRRSILDYKCIFQYTVEMSMLESAKNVQFCSI